LKAENETPAIKPSLKVLIIRGFVVIVYLLLGGLVFRALEHNNDPKWSYANQLEIERRNLQREFNISESRLHSFEKLVRKRKTNPKDWDYYQSLYFASTVTTTIGLLNSLYFFF